MKAVGGQKPAWSSARINPSEMGRVLAAGSSAVTHPMVSVVCRLRGRRSSHTPRTWAAVKLRATSDALCWNSASSIITCSTIWSCYRPVSHSQQIECEGFAGQFKHCLSEAVKPLPCRCGVSPGRGQCAFDRLSKARSFRVGGLQSAVDIERSGHLQRRAVQVVAYQDPGLKQPAATKSHRASAHDDSLEPWTSGAYALLIRDGGISVAYNCSRMMF